MADVTIQGIQFWTTDDQSQPWSRDKPAFNNGEKYNRSERIEVGSEMRVCASSALWISMMQSSNAQAYSTFHTMVSPFLVVDREGREFPMPWDVWLNVQFVIPVRDQNDFTADKRVVMFASADALPSSLR